MARTRHVQARLDEDAYQALQQWAQSHSMSLTSAVNLAIRVLTGLVEQKSKAPESMMGLLADTDVMEEMERERARELGSERTWR